MVTATSKEVAYVFAAVKLAKFAFGWLMISSRKLGTLPPIVVPPLTGAVCAEAIGAATAMTPTADAGDERTQLHFVPSGELAS